MKEIKFSLNLGSISDTLSQISSKSETDIIKEIVNDTFNNSSIVKNENRMDFFRYFITNRGNRSEYLLMIMLSNNVY